MLADEDVVQLAGCGGGNCPKIFLAGDGQSIFFQGFDLAEPGLPSGERVVRLPRDVVDAAVARLLRSDL